MRNKYTYYGYQSALDKETITALHSQGINQLKSDEQQGLNTTPEIYSGVDEKQRKGKVSFLQSQFCLDILMPYVKEMNERSGWKYQIDYTEALQFTVYEEGDHCDWHSDGGSDHFSAYRKHYPNITLEDGIKYTQDENMVGKVRKLSFTVDISPEKYEGGDFYIKTDTGEEQKIDILPGTIIAFPSYTEHKITPVTKGTRYSMVLWCLGYPFK